MQKTTIYLKAILLAIVLVLGSAYVSAWTAPVSDPPGGFVDLSVNVSNNTQLKTGTFGAGSLISATSITVGGLKNCAAISTDKDGNFSCTTVAKTATTKEWTTPGTYTFTVPAGVTTIDLVTVGGGGSGGSGESVSGPGIGDHYSGGGGGGGDIETYTLPVAPGDAVTVKVGASGQISNIIYKSTTYALARGGSNGTNGSAGSPMVCTETDPTWGFCTGWSGGVPATNGVGGAGGTGTNPGSKGGNAGTGGHDMSPLAGKGGDIKPPATLTDLPAGYGTGGDGGSGVGGAGIHSGASGKTGYVRFSY